MRDTHGRFIKGSIESIEGGKKGGAIAQAKGTAHKLTKEEQSRGGKNSNLTTEQAKVIGSQSWKNRKEKTI